MATLWQIYCRVLQRQNFEDQPAFHIVTGKSLATAF